ncbi:terminase [Tomitella fengzijianii]|uniref:Terminase n=1 Tax=Tomitella fengzijianii TaxID=2597660 RepID=A0A516X4H1_9ACTN|nr:terminase [Tomitella fengzijianii]QDQ97975.1 terminase [Tomitella fengzijianii]
MARKGRTEPRVWTPPARELTPETSLGFEAITFAEDVLGITLFPWQKWVLIHALELNEDGNFRFRTVLLLVARQNGKSTLLLVLTLWRMFVDEAPLVLGTAQNLDISEELWQEALDVVQATPDLADEVPDSSVVKANGKKSFRTRDGQRYKVTTASRKGGRGLSGDLILLDELREHATFAAWSAVTKTTMARARAQIWGASNAGDTLSIVLRRLRALAHRDLGWPDGDDESEAIGLGATVLDDDEDDDTADDSLALFEYSAPPGCSVADRDGWTYANPSLGYSITERAIAAAMRTDPEPEFRTEVLCQWVSSTAPAPFPVDDWQATLDNDSRLDPASVTIVAIDVSWLRDHTFIARSGFRRDGTPHVEITASRPGTDWVMDWLEERRDRIDAVVVQTNGAPASSFVDKIDRAGIPRIDWSGGRLGRAHGLAYDHIVNHTVRHLQHPGLDLAAATAYTKRSGDAWIIDRRTSPHDAAPLIAFIAALWALDQELPDATPISAYEDADLVFL